MQSQSERLQHLSADSPGDTKKRVAPRVGKLTRFCSHRCKKGLLRAEQAKEKERQASICNASLIGYAAARHHSDSPSLRFSAAQLRAQNSLPCPPSGCATYQYLGATIPQASMPQSAALRPWPALNVAAPLGVTLTRLAASGAAIPFVKAALKSTPAP